MKKHILLFICLYVCLNASGQTSDFNNLFKACVMASSSMAYGEGSMGELKEATALMTGAQWGPLLLQGVDIAGECGLKGHMVFSPSFLKGLQDNRNVFKKAKEYAAELDAAERGADLLLCTKCIKAESSVSYNLRTSGNAISVAAVSEVNGLINLEVAVLDGQGDERVYKINSDEFKGASKRCLNGIPLPQGLSSIKITITNKTKLPKSVAIIVE